MNAFARSQTWMNTPLNVGIWYAGNSITNGAGSPAKKRVFFNAIPDKIITKILKKYIAGAIQVLPGKNAELIIPIITVFAPQGINVHNRISDSSICFIFNSTCTHNSWNTASCTN